MPTQRRVLTSRLAQYMTEDERRNIATTAESIDIAPNTLRKLLTDSWDQVGRSTLERVCDRFNISLDQLFEFKDDTFWMPFAGAEGCALVRGPGEGKSERRFLDPFDGIARGLISAFLQSTIAPQIRPFVLDVSSEGQVIDAVKNHNCIIAGSPKTNPATEVVISRLFGVPPYRADARQRRQIPFRFVFAKQNSVQSSLAEPWSSTRGRTSGVGIYQESATDMLVEIDWWPYADYMKRTIRRGHDGAIVVVINKPFKTSKNVKTILVAGLSGVGTEAAARAVLRDYRDLEPASPGVCVGVLEATYNKLTPGRDERRLVGYRWKFLQGSRSHVASLEGPKVANRLTD